MSTVPIPGRSAPTRPPLDPKNPWPGLDSFHEADQQFFRGRTRDSKELLSLVQGARISVLYGVSGIGKSSLLEAGLFPLLREQGMLPVRIRLDFSNEHADFVSQLKQAIAAEAADQRIEAPVPSELETLWEFFHLRDHTFWDERNRLTTPVLVLDQFEEIFTLGSPKGIPTPRTRELITQLADLAEGSPPDALQQCLDEHPEDASRFEFNRHPYRILISLREDFLAQLDDFRPLMPSIAMNRRHLLPMDGRAAMAAANQAPELMSLDVAEQVVRFVGAADSSDRDLSELVVDPAFLSLMCSELNEKRKRRGEPTITADLLQGSRTEILRDFYDRAMHDVSPATRVFVEEKLVLDPGYRDTVALDLALQVPGVTRNDVDQLVRRRLIRMERRGAMRRIELTHDLLIGVILESRNKRHVQEKAKQERAARLEAEQRERQARRALQRTRVAVLIFAMLFVAAVFFAIEAHIAEAHAKLNKRIAEDATDSLAGLAGSHSVEIPDEAPETLAFREQLLTKAKEIYARFNNQDQKAEDVRREIAMGHFRSGDLYRLRGDISNAVAQYHLAIQKLDGLVKDFPKNAAYRNALGDAYNWLGETLRPFPSHAGEAEMAYENAIAQQRDQLALAQTYDNRGILRLALGRYTDANADFRSAIAILLPLQAAERSEAVDQAQQVLARTKNNLGRLIYIANTPGDARTLYEQAIDLGEELVKRNPANREYKLELAQYENNSAILLEDEDTKSATRRNQKAIDLVMQLSEPAPYLTMQLALFHSIRASILDRAGEDNARAEYQTAIDTLRRVPVESQTHDFHIWLGQALAGLAGLPNTGKQAAIQLLLQAIQEQKTAASNYNLAWDYYYLASAYRDLKSFADMQQALQNSRSLSSQLPPPDRERLTKLLDEINGQPR